MPVDHYENFPVASFLLPKRLRTPVEAIYRFARSADDLADEGDASPVRRQADLAAYDAQLARIGSGVAPAAEPAGPMFKALAATIRAHALPVSLLRDLLSAFSQDCVVTEYQDDPVLLDYCRRSANPVGRLMLLLYRQDSELHRAWSDRICTALQWINFWQDVAVDRAKGRVYLPQADLVRFGVTRSMLFGDAHALVESPGWKNLMRHEVGRTRAMMIEGSPLATALRGRIGIELRMIVQGGLRILERIERVDFDVFFRRPVLGKMDAIVMGGRALTMASGRTGAPAAAKVHAAPPLQSPDDA